MLPEDRLEKFGPSYLEIGKQVGGSQRSCNDLVSTGKQDCGHNIQKTAEPSLVSLLTISSFFLFSVLRS